MYSKIFSGNLNNKNTNTKRGKFKQGLQRSLSDHTEKKKKKKRQDNV